MPELSEILKKEAQQKQEVETAKKQAQDEIEKKKQELSAKLEGAGISKEQHSKVLEYKTKQMDEIEKQAEQNLKTQLSAIERKAQANSGKAVEYIMNTLTQGD